VRNVGYALRKLLGWVDARGEPTQGKGDRGFPTRALADDLGRESWAVDLSEMTRTVVVLCFEL